jgi:hypothetical protein
MPPMNRGPQGPQAMSADTARQILKASAASVGRFQAPELFYSQDVSFASVNSLNVPRPLNLNRPIESMQIKLRFRLTVTVANVGTVVPESPQSVLQSVILNGTHRQYGNLTPVRMSGATLFSLQRMFQPFGNDLLINDVRAADPGRPFTSPWLGTTAASPYDIEITYNVPFGPQMGVGQSTKRDLASYLLQPQDWGDTLQLQLNFGDTTAFGVAGGATIAVSAYGSGAGNPSCAIYLNYSILGPFANSLQTGVVIRQEQLFNTFVTAGTALRISQLQKQITTNLILKAGTSQTATAGVTNFQTLSDRQLDRTQILVDNKPVKNNQSNISMKAYLGRMFNTIQPAGYFNLSFVEGQNPQLAYRGDGLAGGSLYEVFSDVLTTGATQILAMTQEMIYGGPFESLRPL